VTPEEIMTAAVQRFKLPQPMCIKVPAYKIRQILLTYEIEMPFWLKIAAPNDSVTFLTNKRREYEFFKTDIE
jgi:hypothetical protein